MNFCSKRNIYKVDKSIFNMREVKVTYSNGDVIETDINGTDKEIKEYFKIGRVFNVGRGVNDELAKVKKVEILK